MAGYPRTCGGEAVLRLQSCFLTMWYNTTGENLFHERHFPPPVDLSHTAPDPSRQRRAGLTLECHPQQSYIMLVTLARETTCICNRRFSFSTTASRMP